MRAAIPVLLLVAVAALLLLRSGGGSVRAVETPLPGPAPSMAVPAHRLHSRTEQPRKRIPIGSFERPEHVPRYRILQRRIFRHRDVRVARLLVDTRAGGKRAYTLITRDVKARFARYDAISIEFTNSAGNFGYDGSALIFNTAAGSRYIGYIYAPPNDRGYLVGTGG